MQAWPRGTIPSPSSSAAGHCSLMCSTKSVVGGHGGPSRVVPSCRATTRAAARSLRQDTSVKLVRPKELHSPTSRNTAPYPDGRTGDATAALPPAASGGASRHPVSSTTPARAHTAPGPHPRTRIVVPPEDPRHQPDLPPPGHARQVGSFAHMGCDGSVGCRRRGYARPGRRRDRG